MAELDIVQAMYNEALFTSEMREEDLAKELDSDDLYKTNYLTAKWKMSEAVPTTILSTSPTLPLNASRASTVKTTKLPRIELPKFSGSVKDWLPFRSQFKKINDDATLTKEDKFQYLLQSVVSGSRTYNLVSIFPPTVANYDKAIACLKNRFGRDDLVVEFYVRTSRTCATELRKW